MIKKLRRKFILINMALVSVVLLVVFGVQCFSTFQRARDDSFKAMRSAMDIGLDGQMPKKEFGPPRHGPGPRSYAMTPSFCVVLGEGGTIGQVLGENIEIADEVLKTAVARVTSQEARDGLLRDLGLRYLKQDVGGTVKIAFADTGGERSAMTSIVLSSLLVGAGALVAFFFVSLFLSGMALRPVAQAWERQRQFVADASHELKTPVTVILANAGILLDHRQDTIDRQSKWVDYIEDEALRMKRLVEDLLFLAKSDAGRQRVTPMPVDFSDTVWNALLPFEPVAFEQGITLDSEIAPDLVIEGDEARLRQMVVILLDNACKYAGEKGLVTVNLKKTGERACLAVRNTGDPIPSAHLPHLFERFYRSDAARARDKGGYGLGLAIAKTIVESHRGKIAVESGEGTGTVFTVTLPLKPAYGNSPQK